MTNETKTRSDYMALALTGCVTCNGTGLRDQKPCNCVLRSIFRIVLHKVHECAAGGHLRPILFDSAHGPQNRQGNARVYEDFSADVYNMAKRILTEPNEWDVFRFHYLQGADYKLCCRRLRIDRGTFYHRCYAVEQKLGNAFATTVPYPLYPVDEYFRRTTRPVDIRPLPLPRAPYPNGVPVRPFLAQRPPQAPAPDTEAFEAVKAAIRLAYSQGKTLTEIARDLNARGVLPRRSDHWYPAIVRSVVLQRAA
jgi:hypothetical protein